MDKLDKYDYWFLVFLIGVSNFTICSAIRSNELQNKKLEKRIEAMEKENP